MTDDKDKNSKDDADYKRFFIFLSLIGFCALSWILFLTMAKNLLALIF